MRARTSLLALVTLAAVAGTSSDAAADSPPGAITFATVDSYTADSSYVTITGVEQGKTAPSTWDFNLNWNGNYPVCEKQIYVMLNRPGRFTLTLDAASPMHCTLKRVP